MSNLKSFTEELLAQSTSEVVDLLRVLKDEYGIFPSGDRLFERRPDEDGGLPRKISRQERRKQARQELKKKCKKRG